MRARSAGHLIRMCLARPFIRQAAEASGVHRVNIGVFEADTKTPTLATLYKLAAAYGVNVCDLLPGGELNGAVVPPAEEDEEVEPPAKAEMRPKGRRGDRLIGRAAGVSRVESLVDEGVRHLAEWPPRGV
jgi:transcriptional regulator with XRE-family HTH domain